MAQSVNSFEAEASIPFFDVVSGNWEKWKRSISFYLLAKAIKNDDQKQAIVLHKDGEQLQDVFFSIPDHNQVPLNVSKFTHTINVLGILCRESTTCTNGTRFGNSSKKKTKRCPNIYQS